MRRRVGSWAEQIGPFLQWKRSRGFKYVRAELWLRAFERFARTRPKGEPLDQLIRSWLARNSARKPVSVTLELGVFRQFCSYLRRHDPKVVIPSRSWAPQSTVSDFFPHILTLSDVKKLLRLTRGLGRPPFRSDMYRALLLVLYCTGLRFGEAIRLRLCDLDLLRSTFWIEESKGRSRWVPFHRSLARELAHYLVARRAYATAAATDALFPRADGTHVRVKTASYTVCALLRRADLKPTSGRLGPRPYDLRHTFAVHRLARWYRAGTDIHTRLPWLSAYMGHDSILGTETYLTATPELLHLAARRLEHRLSQRVRWK